eukprot:scaffold4111_cov49-Attheya_sp.AAC.2
MKGTKISVLASHFVAKRNEPTRKAVTVSTVSGGSLSLHLAHHFRRPLAMLSRQLSIKCLSPIGIHASSIVMKLSCSNIT